VTEEIIKAIAEGKPVWYRAKGTNEWRQLSTANTLLVLSNPEIEWRLHRPVDDLPWQVQAALGTQAHSKVYKKGWLDCCMALKPELKLQCEAAREELE